MIGFTIRATDGHIAGAWSGSATFGIAIPYSRRGFIEVRHARPRGRWYGMSRRARN